MNKNNREYEQPKVQRHEEAKEKCRIYQRSLSTKGKINPIPRETAPLPGQFAVQKPEFRLTTNIKNIMKDNHPQTAANFLSRSSNKRISIARSSSKGQRPVESRQTSQQRKSIWTGQCQKSERVDQPKKSSYLIKQRIPVAKYSSGYRAVKLESTQKLKINVQSKQQFRSKEAKVEEEAEQIKFLPLQYYLIDDQTPEELMKQYRIAGSDYVLGYSRWYDVEGNNTWKKCRVLSYSTDNSRWNIEWLHNSKVKQVSRANLYFEGESKHDFENRLKFAQEVRRNSEVYYKYHIQIDQMDSKPNPIPQKKYLNIMARTGRSQSCQRFGPQVKQLYIRANKQAEFNFHLPYDQQKKQEFKQFLPSFFFQPHQQHMMRYKKHPPPKIASSSRSYFQTAANKFKDQTSLAHKSRLIILTFMNQFEIQQETLTLLSCKTEGTTTLDNMVASSLAKTKDLVKQLEKVICNIEHCIGNELDQLYVDKKQHPDQFQKQTKQYSSFLSMIIVRLEALVRSILFNTYQQCLNLLKTNQQQPLVYTKRCQIQLKLIVKDLRIECEPSAKEIYNKITEMIAQITSILKSMPCPTKSYLQSFRNNGLLHIEHEPFQLGPQLKLIEEYLKANTKQLEQFMSEFSSVTEEMLGMGGQIKSKLQKKNNYSQISEFIDKMKQLQSKLQLILVDYPAQNQNSLELLLFTIKIDDVLNRCKKRMAEGYRELYRLVVEKISRENEKIEKTITALEEKLEIQPQNILEMLGLEKLVREQAGEELEKVQNKLKELPEKIALLQSIQPIEYRDYELLNHVHFFPLKLKEKLKTVKKDIESTYRKRFGEELNRDAGKVLLVTKECYEEMLSCFKIESLEEMCGRFMQFSNLNDKIKNGLKEATVINERQEAMSWSRTDFSKLKTLENDFSPYYTLITLAKNYQLHLETLASGPFNKIDPVSLEKEFEESKEEFIKIKTLFNMNTRMLRISMEVEQEYNTFAEHLPLIKALRNPDLRERHWISIREIIAINPLDDEVSLKKLINAGVEAKLQQLQQISAIATRELVYQRRLMQLKRQWKQVRFHFGESEGLINVINIKQLCSRVEVDIFQIQQMLGANFIKFLEGQILCWRNQVLYKAYELLEKWEKLQNEVLLLSAIFSKPRAVNQLPRQHFQFQLLEKSWKALCAQIQVQPTISDILQSRALQSLTSLNSTSERIRKQLYAFFEDKKRQYARLACISDDQFVNLLSYDKDDPEQNPVFQQTVRKCFQNIKSLIRNDRKQIIKIQTCAGQELQLKQLSHVQKIVEYVLPNEVIMQLQNQIQKELRQSLEMFIQNPQIHIMQVLLLYQRLNFTTKMEQELSKNQCVSSQLINEFEKYRNELVETLPKQFSPKHCTELLQALYHLQLAVSLYQHEYLDVFSFPWISQPRTYLKNDEYIVEVGLYSESYGFEIVDLDELVTEEWSSRVFCSMAGAIKDRGMCLISGEAATGKISAICKMAALLGRKEHILQGGSLISARNLLEFVRMAASGLWVIMRHIQNLQSMQLSILCRNIESLWLGFLCHPSQSVMIQSAGINFKTSHLKIFATTTLLQHRISQNIRQTLCSTFRHIFFSHVNLEFIVGAKLLLQGVNDISPLKITIIIEHIINKFKTLSPQLSVHSEISFTTKLFICLKSAIVCQSGEQLLEWGLSQLLVDLVKDEKQFQKISEDLFNSFSIKIQYDKMENDNFKNQFVNQKYYYNQHMLNTCSEMVEAVQHKNIVVIAGAHDTGKSTLIKILKDSGNIKLEPICPNAYSIGELYGREDLNGILCYLLQKILKILKNEEENDCLHGLLLDGELGNWAQPLAKIVNSGHIIQPNGNRLLIQENIKLVYECQQLKNANPALLMDAKLLTLQQPLKWQNVFNWYLNTQFYGSYGQAFYLKYFELLIPYIVDPMMEYYHSAQNQYKNSYPHSFIPDNSLILSLLRLYQSLLRYQFLDETITQFNEKVSSDSFNLFIMALVWTFGASLPIEARKFFQRHFKYLIKRAVQVHVSGVTKESLPEEDQDLFNSFYNQGKWEEWKRPDLYFHSPTMILNKPSDIGLNLIIERVLERGEGVILTGPNSGFKTLFMDELQKSISSEAYKTIKLSFQPNSNTHTIQKVIIKEMNKQKYSFNFNGFAHGKKTIIVIRDISLPIFKHHSNTPISIYEFIRHYYVTNGWYLSDSDKHYSFKNLIFCATMNDQHPLPVSLSKYVHTFKRPFSQQDLTTIINKIVKGFNNVLPSLTEMIIDLHSYIIKQFRSNVLTPLSSSEAIVIAKGLTLLKNPSKNQLIRFWIFLTQKIYQQRLKESQKQRIFYNINNVLMEKQKIRYRSIKNNYETFSTYFYSPTPTHFNMSSFRKEIERKWKKMIEESLNDPASNEDKNQDKIFGFDKLREKKIISVDSDVTFKDSELKLISYICSTFDMQTPFILSLAIAGDSETPTLDLQEALEVSAVLRGARLLPAKLGEDNQIIWKTMMLSLIEQMLSHMQSGGDHKQIIIFLYDFKSSNDFVIDDLITMKRNKQLPYLQEMQKLFELYLQSRGKLNADKGELSDGPQSQYYNLQNRPKGRERIFENIRKERQRELKEINDLLLSKIKIVLNIKAASITEIQEHHAFKYYQDMLKEFSILNVTEYCKDNIKIQQPAEPIVSAHELKVIGENPLITDIDQKEERIGTHKFTMLSRKESQQNLTQSQELILESVASALMNRFCLLKEKQWLRGRNNDIKKLYYRIRQKLITMCNDKAERLNSLIYISKSLKDLKETLIRTLTLLSDVYKQVEMQYEVIKKQKIQRQLQYERCVHQNQSIQKNIIDLQKQRIELQICYERMVEKHYKDFCSQRENLSNIIKLGKDKKINNISIELKILLEALSVVLDRKNKKEEEAYKEIIKDINNPINNLKLAKKVITVLPTSNFNINEKIIFKLRDLLKDIQIEKIEKRPLNEEREEPFPQKITKKLKVFFSKLLEFNNRTQQKEIKECLKRLTDNQKIDEKLHDNLSKNLKSPQYKSILQSYQLIREHITALEQKMQEIKQKKLTTEKIYNIYREVYQQPHPILQYKCGKCTQKCNFFCYVEKTLKEEENITMEIADQLPSYAFTLTVTTFYALEDQQPEIHKIIQTVISNRKRQLDDVEIQFLYEDLPKLAILSPLCKNKKIDPREQIKQLKELAKNEASIFMTLSKEFQSNSFLALARFVPANIVIGVDPGSLSNCTVPNWIPDRGMMSIISQLFGDFVINSSELLDWIRRSNNFSKKKFALSSRVLISQKNLSKSVISVANDFGEEGKLSSTCLAIATTRQQYKNCIKIINREITSSEVNVLLVAEKSIIGLQQHIFTVYLKNEDLQLLQKQIQSIVFVDYERGETQSEMLLKESQHNKQKAVFAVNLLMEVFSSSKLELLIQQIELEASYYQKQSKFAVKYQDDQLKRQKQLKLLQLWVNQMTEYFGKWLHAIGKEEDMLRITNEKAKLYLNNQKISKALSLLCETLIFLQDREWLTNSLSAFKYLQILQQIFQHSQNQNSLKKSLVGIKQPLQFKMLLWNYLASLYPKQELILFLVFLFIYEVDQDAFKQQALPAALCLCLQVYQKSSGYLECVKGESQLQLVDLYFYNSNVDLVYLKQNLKRTLIDFQKCLKESSLVQSFENNTKEWHALIKNIDANTFSLPPELFTNNKLVILLLLCIFNPASIPQWAKRLDLDCLLFKPEEHQLHLNNNIKTLFYGISQISFQPEWVYLPDRLYYNYHNLGNKQVFLVNYQTEDIISLCQTYKLNFVMVDPTLLFCKIDRFYKNKKQKPDEHTSEQHQQSSKQYEKLIEELKLLVKNENWIIINLNHHRLINLTLIELHQKINDIFEAILHPTRIDTQPTQETPLSYLISLICKHSNKNVDLNQYKFMLVFLVNSTSQTHKELANNWLQYPSSCLYFQDHYQTANNKSQLTSLISNFIYEYYLGLSKSKKSKKQYEKLPFLHKKIIFEFLFLSHHLLKTSSTLPDNCSHHYLEQTLNRIYNCLHMIKSNFSSKFTNEDEELIKKYQSKLHTEGIASEKDTFRLNAVMKVEEYTLLLIEYAFEISYRHKHHRQRIHITYELVNAIRTELDQLANYEIESILIYLKTEEHNFNLVQDSLLEASVRSSIEQVVTHFNPSSFEEMRLQPVSEEKIRSHQQKILRIMLSDNKIDYPSKRQQIQELYEQERIKLEEAVSTLNILGLDSLNDYYSQNIKKVENILEKKHGSKLSKLSQEQKKNINLVVLNAITQILDYQSTAKHKDNHKPELNRLYEDLINGLVSLFKKMSAFQLFINLFRSISQQYYSIKLKSSEQMSMDQADCSSSDQEQNMRKRYENQLRSMIKSRVAMKFTVNSLMSKITQIYCKLHNYPVKSRQTDLNSSELNQLYLTISEISMITGQLSKESEQSIKNYNYLEEYINDSIMNIEKHSYSSYNSTLFIFRFDLHSLQEIIDVSKLIHAKKNHQEIHLVSTVFRITGARQVQEEESTETHLYFKGFKLVNAQYRLFNNKLFLEAKPKHITNCQDLYIEITIKEQTVQEQDNVLEDSSILYNCPFYIIDKQKNVEHKETVIIKTYEFQEEELLKSNIYLITQ